MHTIMEKLLEDLLFDAAYLQGQQICIERKYVEDRLKNIVEDDDLSRYIL